jgi:F0F1-type ATP synthase assembly protein I
MKRLKPNTRVNNDDALGKGMDAVITMALFLGLGYLVDRWLGTEPLFMIVFTLVASVGLFLKFKYAYDARMEQLEAERARRTGPPRDERSAA